MRINRTGSSQKNRSMRHLSAEDFVIELADDYDSDFVLYGGGLENGHSVYQWRTWQRADDLDSIARESKSPVKGR